MRRIFLRSSLALVVTCLSLGCAPKRPVLYPNGTLERVGEAEAQRDVDDCVQMAANHGHYWNPAGQTAGRTVEGAAVGAAVGSAVGAVRGRNVGNRAAAGAAGGSAAGFVRGLFRWRDPDPLQARFVEICLRERGYRMVGWK